jgi:hypothetical protein
MTHLVSEHGRHLRLVAGAGDRPVVHVDGAAADGERVGGAVPNDREGPRVRRVRDMLSESPPHLADEVGHRIGRAQWPLAFDACGGRTRDRLLARAVRPLGGRRPRGGEPYQQGSHHGDHELVRRHWIVRVVSLSSWLVPASTRATIW